MYGCVCVYVSMHTCVHAHMHASMFLCAVCACVHVCWVWKSTSQASSPVMYHLIFWGRSLNLGLTTARLLTARPGISGRSYCAQRFCFVLFLFSFFNMGAGDWTQAPSLVKVSSLLNDPSAQTSPQFLKSTSGQKNGIITSEQDWGHHV